MIRKVILAVIFLFLQSCTYLDDFMLGKDNTPKPTPLTEIKSKVPLKLKWSIVTSHSSKSRAFLKLKPVVRGNIIYTANESGTVQAVNKTTGHLLWSKQLKSGILSGPTVGEGYIVLGTNRSNVIILNQADGAEVAILKISGDALSKPVIKHHIVIIKTIDGNLYGFDLKTGKKIWETEHGSPTLILKASSSPIVMGKLVLVGYSDGKLDAVDIQSGTVMWQRSIVYATGASDIERLVDIDADPIVRGEIVYLASYQGYVGAISLSNGQFIWRKPASVYKNIAIDDTNLYITDSNDVVWAFDKRNGQIKWKQDALKARGLTEPVLLGNHLIVGDRIGYIHALSLQNGELLSRLDLNSPIDISPAVSGRNLFVMTANGKLSRIVVK